MSRNAATLCEHVCVGKGTLVQVQQFCSKKEAANVTSWVEAASQGSYNKGPKQTNKLVSSDLMLPSRFQVLLQEEKMQTAKENARAEEWKNAVENARVEMERQKQAFVDAGLSWPEEQEHLRKKGKQEKTQRRKKVNKHKHKRGQRGKWARKGCPGQHALAGLDKMSRTSMFYIWSDKTHKTNQNALTTIWHQYLLYIFIYLYIPLMECSDICSGESLESDKM